MAGGGSVSGSEAAEGAGRGGGLCAVNQSALEGGRGGGVMWRAGRHVQRCDVTPPPVLHRPPPPPRPAAAPLQPPPEATRPAGSGFAWSGGVSQGPAAGRDVWAVVRSRSEAAEGAGRGGGLCDELGDSAASVCKRIKRCRAKPVWAP